MQHGEEICETVLNYRRDGSAFLNLLLLSPLCDNKGNARYFLGCQIDITNLVDEGKGLESFQMLLEEDKMANRYGENAQKKSDKALRDLSLLMNAEEMEILQERRQNNSRPVTPALSLSMRRYVGVDESAAINIWPPTSFGKSGRLPGVYQNVSCSFQNNTGPVT